MYKQKRCIRNIYKKERGTGWGSGGEEIKDDREKMLRLREVVRIKQNGYLEKMMNIRKQEMEVQHLKEGDVKRW